MALSVRNIGVDTVNRHALPGFDDARTKPLLAVRHSSHARCSKRRTWLVQSPFRETTAVIGLTAMGMRPTSDLLLAAIFTAVLFSVLMQRTTLGHVIEKGAG
ncbi:MAG: hypothetical protein WA954_09640 [Parerythrobacter sp.]